VDELRKMITGYEDAYLLDQYFNRKNEYTPEALEVLREEIERRKINEAQLRQYISTRADIKMDGPVRLKSEDFVQFDHVFSHTDILLAHAILRETGVPFYIDNPSSSDTIPLESEAQKVYTIHVHKDSADTAHAALDEAFSKSDGVYVLKYSSVRDRLRAFNFHDLHINEHVAAEQVEVAFTPEEKVVIQKLAQRLLAEADEIEQQQGRVLFYYDTFEPLIELLSEPRRTTLSRTELLAVMELLQVYCDDPQFPAAMEGTVATLLAFFLGIEQGKNE
jgi:hypothetical protein